MTIIEYQTKGINVDNQERKIYYWQS